MQLNIKTIDKLRIPLFAAACVGLTVLALASGRVLAQEARPVTSPEEIKASMQRTEPVEEKAATAQTHPNNPELWNVDKMMEEAVIQISRRYNLNKAQEEYTRLLLVNRTQAFLEVHEKEVRELLRESIDLRLGLKPGTPEAYRRWAERAAPIYAAAQMAILDGNEEWGVILDVEQKKIHDADLAAMRTSFAQVDRMIETWKTGQAPVAMASTQQPAKSPQTETGLQGGGEPLQQGRVSEPHQPVIQQQVEDTWLAYVNRFIHTYKLDERQAISARDKVYKDIRDQATQFRESRKAEFAALEAEAQSPKPKMDRKEIERRRRELERPLGEMFVTLDQRLRTLPDRRQLAGADPTEVRQLLDLYKLLAGEFGVEEKREKPETDAKKGVKAQPAVPAEKSAEPEAEPTPKPTEPTSPDSSPDSGDE